MTFQWLPPWQSPYEWNRRRDQRFGVLATKIWCSGKCNNLLLIRWLICIVNIYTISIGKRFNLRAYWHWTINFYSFNPTTLQTSLIKNIRWCGENWFIFPFKLKGKIFIPKYFSTRKCRYIERDFESLPMFCTYSISRHLEENEAQDLLRCLVLIQWFNEVSCQL